MKTQTILGAGGAVGRELAPALLQYTDRIRLVSRNPRKINPDDELFAADLLDPAAVMSAVEGSAVVYLTAGLPYKRKVWEAQWPLIMRNVIAACRTHRARLVFFDNIYMYSGDRLDPITEELPVDPPSRKGAVRAHVAQMLLDAHSAGGIEALIARSADFYGPGTGAVSVLNETVFKPLGTGGTANWLGGADFRHSFTYVPDAARATALLGNTPAPAARYGTCPRPRTRRPEGSGSKPPPQRWAARPECAVPERGSYGSWASFRPSCVSWWR